MNPTGATLQQLRDVHLPAAPSWWPPAPGWWIVATLLLFAACLAALWLARRRQSARRRGQVLDELDCLGERLRNGPNRNETIAEISTLLRRVALLYHAPVEVAALNGERWLKFLDSTGGNGRFCHGPGQVLGDGAYRRDPVADAEALLPVARDWLIHNLTSGAEQR